MAILTPFARMRFVGKLCRLGAWIIAALGLAAIIIFYLVSTNAFNASGNGPGNGPSLNDLFMTLFFMLIIAILVSFFSLILYASGTLLTYMGSGKEPQQESPESQQSDEPVMITSLPEM